MTLGDNGLLIFMMRSPTNPLIGKKEPVFAAARKGQKAILK